jgi:UDP-N-acetylmuramoyl-tripeptide--D-alanyl-D-alanine ligase
MKTLFRKIVVTIIWWQARQILRKYNPKIVAITGSVGKTSTKDAIFTVLSASFYARKSDKSFNSEIGVPLTILGRPNGWNNFFIWAANILWGFRLIFTKMKYPEWLILELGVDRPGGLAKITKSVRPDVSVVTRFGKVPAHVEFFHSREAVIHEKSHIVRALKPGGLLVLNADDEDVLALKELSREKTVTYGIETPSTLRGNNYLINYTENNGFNSPDGFVFKADYDGSSLPISVKGVLGNHHIYPILAGLLVGIEEGLPLLNSAEVFKNHEPPPGRMHLVPGVKNTMIIDDSYNSSPVALGEALEALREVKTKGRKIAILGDMLEIGRYSGEEHKKLGEKAAEVVDILVTVGIRARSFAEGALNGGMSEKVIYQYEDSRGAGKFVENLLKPGDIILVKGSQGVRMEKAVEEIMAEPEKKRNLLVRQDEEWARR